MAPLAIVPGYGNSGQAHWQTLWMAHFPDSQRLAPASWTHPDCTDWVSALGRLLSAFPQPPIIVAHSLGCLAVAHGLNQQPDLAGRISAAMLVAPPDPSGPYFPADAASFAPLPRGRLPCRSMVVASSDDAYGDVAHAEATAATWGAELVMAGPLGHINAASGLGIWSQGLILLHRLQAI